MVFNQNTDEALQRAQNSTVQHYRTRTIVVFCYIFGIQTLRQHKVQLQGTALPRATQGIFNMVLNLRTIECAFARQFFPLYAASGQCITQTLFGFIPNFVRTCTLFRAKGQLHSNIMEAKLFINANQQFIECACFINDLILGTEDMRIILHKTANTHQTMQCTAWFIAVARTELGQTHR